MYLNLGAVHKLRYPFFQIFYHLPTSGYQSLHFGHHLPTSNVTICLWHPPPSIWGSSQITLPIFPDLPPLVTNSYILAIVVVIRMLNKPIKCFRQILKISLNQNRVNWKNNADFVLEKPRVMVTLYLIDYLPT